MSSKLIAAGFITAVVVLWQWQRLRIAAVAA
jgi:hypothetical protein